MNDVSTLKIVDGATLPDELRRVLRPGKIVTGEDGRAHTLPQYFFEIDSWDTAKATALAPNFSIYEFIAIDVREAEVLRRFPRYLPLGVALMAAHLAVLRQQVGTYVHIAANGGYRSPAHAVGDGSSPHHWGTAVNIYRIGDDFMDSEENIARYTEVIKKCLPFVWVRPYGRDPGCTIDHLHLDLGRLVVTPRRIGD